MADYSLSSEGRERAEALMRNHERYESERANFDMLWEQIAERLFPRAQHFTTKQMSQGDLRGERVFDNTPGLALDRFAAAVGSYLTPDSDQWHGLEVSDPDLNENEEVREYLEIATDRLFAARYRPGANFSSNMHECYLGLGAFGTCALFIDEAMGAHLRYRAMHLSEIYLGENHQGLVDRIHRGRFSMKAYQVAQLARDPNPAKRWTLPECVKRALDGPTPNPMAEFEFIHCVYPNEDADPRFADWRGMAYRSTYICCTDRSIVHEGGYRSMPYSVGRYVTGPRETYGRSPAMTVFRDILMLNEMNKDVIRAAQLQVDPPILVSEDGALSPFSMAPRSLNYGYLSDDGKPLAQALRPEGELAVGLELIQDRRDAINHAFLITLFEILVDNPKQTATEALLRAQEKGQLLGPALSRQQSELHGTMIERELDILAMAGQLPPMPDALAEAMEEGGAGITVAFKAPINRLQKTDKAVGVLKAWEALTPLAAHDPSVLDVLDIDEGARIVAESAGAPASAMRTPEEIEALRGNRQQRSDIEQMVAAAPQLAKTARDLAQAQATGGNIPQPIPMVQPQ